MNTTGRCIVGCALVATAVVMVGVTTLAATGRPLDFVDLMQFRQIHDAVISDDGSWVVYSEIPDRGDGEVVARSTVGDTEYRVERGEEPVISGDGRWVVAGIAPTLFERDKAEKVPKDGDDKPRTGLSILDLRSGAEQRIDEIEAFALSENGRWLAFKRYEQEKEPTAETPGEVEVAEEETSDDGEDEDKITRDLGAEFILRDLRDGDEHIIEHVLDFAFAESASLLAVTTSAPEGQGNRTVVLDLRGEEIEERRLHAHDGGFYTHPTWAREADHLAFVFARDDAGEPSDAEIWSWTGEGEARRAVSEEDAPNSFAVPSKNELAWSRDGERLFFGFKHVRDESQGDREGEGENESEDQKEFDPYDVDAILEGRGVDVWHWKDPRIIPNQKERWEEHEKDRVYRAVIHLGDDKVVPLAGLEVPEVEPTDNPGVALGRTQQPYMREVTWEGNFADLYVVSLRTGERRIVTRRLAGGWGDPPASLSPDGGFVLFYAVGDWYLFETASGETRNLTAGLPAPFADEDWDYPAEPPGYGHSEWYADSSAVLIYDKYDIWKIPVGRPDPLRGDKPLCMTGGAGRSREMVFRVVDLDPESDTIDPMVPSLILGYHDREKHDGFYGFEGDLELVKLHGDGRHRLKFIAKSEKADRYVFTRERYDEFPDLWVADRGFADAKRVSEANPQLADFAWGSAELVEWTTADGTGLQGVLIKPEGWQPGTRLPVLVYYYRFFSQRLHEFNEPVVNHRPSFPIYASHGYAVFLPDIKFEIGRPGPSAVECLISGIDHLVEIGVADPDAVGLHGHSWSGYQTAFVVTQTDRFAAAVAGAPVSNMTSAYSGIRWGTGLARQFQYEKSQSRIGGSLWETPHLYIENSPVFFADRISTPLLIQFGDEDEAVPWTQGIELYLACRRLDKDCIMLTYSGEPHHLKQYGNKLDYSIKMKQFFDHHLKGEPAPVWMNDGVPYRGD